ncbi:MAG: hypothetical protein HRU11_00445 [Parvularculaceae bacterium]|nr:hypothetical protein [Parvularculaceae bacterium]
MELWSYVTDHPIAAASVGLVLAVGLAIPAFRRSSDKPALATKMGAERTEVAASALAVHEQLIHTLAQPGPSITNASVADVRSRLNGLKTSSGKATRKQATAYTDEAEAVIQDMVASYMNCRNARRRWGSVTSAFITLYRATGAPDADQVAAWAAEKSIAEPGAEPPTALKASAKAAPMMRRKR